MRITFSILISSFFLFSCATPTRTLSEQDLSDMSERFASDYYHDLSVISEKSYRKLTSDYLSQDVDGKSQQYDILVLSGGGELGAFGAGFLEGWGQVNDLEFKRPEFDSVSGISTGALIAPFAFVGTDKAYSTIVDLYRNPDENMIVPQSLLGFLAGNGAFYDASVLHQRISTSISEDLLRQVAEKSKNDNVLLVGATNIDFGVMRVWDIAEIVRQNEVSVAKPMVVEKLIASSAIPSAFPPVIIDENLYVDGGASMQVVSGIDSREWLYTHERSEHLSFVDKKRPIKIRIWIVVNNKLVMEPEVTPAKWSSIATRSLVSLMRGSTLQTIQDTETFAQMINLRPEFDVKMHYVAIPQDYEIAETDDMFDQEKMRSLVDLGRKMGQKPSSWNERAIRPGASFLDIKKLTENQSTHHTQ